MSIKSRTAILVMVGMQLAEAESKAYMGHEWDLAAGRGQMMNGRVGHRKAGKKRTTIHAIKAAKRKRMRRLAGKTR